MSRFPCSRRRLIYLCILSTSASGERSLSVFKRVKNYLRNSISNDHLSALAYFQRIKNLVNAISYDEIIKILAQLFKSKKPHSTEYTNVIIVLCNVKSSYCNITDFVLKIL